MLRDVTTNVTDGLLGFSAAAGDGVQVKIGVSPIQSEKPVLIRGDMTAEKIREKLGHSPLADAVMDAVQFGADRIYCIPAAGTTTGTVGEVKKTGSGTGTLSASGSPTNAFDLIIRITGQGELNAAVFRVSVDGGYSFGEETTVPLTGEYEISGTGVTVTFAAAPEPGEGGSFQVGDEFRLKTTAPAMTNKDVLAAFEKLKHFTEEYELVHIVGASTAETWQAVSEAQKELAEDYKKLVAVILEAAAPDAEEDLYDYAEQLENDRKQVSNYEIQVVAAWGVLVRLDGSTQEVNLAGVATGLYAKAAVQESIGKTRPEAGFQISKSKLTELRPAGMETITEKLDEAGYLTFREYDGLDGYYVYHTKMLSPDGSDYPYMEDVRVLNKINRQIRKEALPLLQDDIDLEDVQGELETRAKFLFPPLQTMIDRKEISAAEILVPEEQVKEFLEDGIMRVMVRYLSRGYVREIVVDLGRTKPDSE